MISGALCSCVEQAVVDVTQLEKLWHKGPDFQKDGAAIPLIFRVATVCISFVFFRTMKQYSDRCWHLLLDALQHNVC